MADSGDDADYTTPARRRDHTFVEAELDTGPRPDRDRPSVDSAGVGAIPSQYDPSRTRKIYAPKSQELQAWVKSLWWKYCSVYNKDPIETLRSYQVPDLYDFFYWMLSERKGRIKKTRTVQTYWNTLTLIRQLETGSFDVEPAVQVEMCGVRFLSLTPINRALGSPPTTSVPWLTIGQARQNLVAEFNLSAEKEAKPMMRAEDEFELLKTLWESPEMSLPHERLRVQLALMIQLAGITGSRPGALRRLQYKDLKIALLPDGGGGEQPRLVMDFTFQHTKRYLGAKDP
ncbi:hypothetical protein LTR86_002635 [Recurvomyces mirabilis]|nr:hypothetical protein LTR86_002635 [Recurvomyces mirabilis]